MSLIPAGLVLLLLVVLLVRSRMRPGGQRPRPVGRQPRLSGPGVEESDPRVEAATMLLAMALARSGVLTPRQDEVIRAEMAPRFALSPEETSALLRHSLSLVADQTDLGAIMRALSRRIVTAPRLSAQDIVELDSMLVAVSEAEGLPTRPQLSLLQIYRDAAGLRT